MNDALQTARDSLQKTPGKPLDGIMIAVDFDSTCVTHAYPMIGYEVPGCVKTLQALVDLGARIILYTVRADMELMAAIQWMRDRHIELWAINHNPTQHKFSSSRKIFADLYIDDSAVGVTLIRDKKLSEKPFVDWRVIRDQLQYRLNIDLPQIEFPEAE